MTTTPDAFDNHIGQWNVEQNKPWGILRYRQTQANLAKHLGSGPLHILDAGGGNGLDSFRWQAKAISSRLLTTRSKCWAMRCVAPRRLIFRTASSCVEANVQDVGHLFPESHFDAVLCHNVLQYVQMSRRS